MTMFQSIDTQRLCELIHSASKRVAFIGPAMTTEVAAAVSNKFSQLDRRGVTIIIDYDEAIFRLGYGHHEAIEILKESGIELRKESGLRISALIIDDQGWILHQSPMAVENPDAPVRNAMALSVEQVKEICAAAGIQDEPSDGSSALSAPNDANERIEIGRAPIPEAEYNSIKKAIDSNPPQAFDLQRQVNVYTANLQFVDIELTGGRVESRTIRLPASLQKQLFGNNDEVDSRLKTSYQLIDSPQFKGLEEIRKDVEELRKYTRQLNKRLGRVILTAKKDRFQKRQLELEDKILTWKKDAKAVVKSEIDKSINALAETLATRVLENPPIELESVLVGEPTKQQSIDFIKGTLYRVAPEPDKLVDDLKLHCIFKDVTYEMLKNEEFQGLIGEHYPDLQSRIMQESSAAKARSTAIEDDLFS